MSTLPTPAKPWHGEALALPNYIGGLPVLSAVRVPTLRGEVSHVWMAILYDEPGRRGPREQLVTCEVHFQGGWRSRDEEHFVEYGAAYDNMISRARVPEMMRRQRLPRATA